MKILLSIVFAFQFSLSIGQQQSDRCLYNAEIHDELRGLKAERDQLFHSCTLDRAYQSLDHGTATYFYTGWVDRDSMLISSDSLKRYLSGGSVDINHLRTCIPKLVCYDTVDVVRQRYIDYRGRAKYQYTAYARSSPTYINGEVGMVLQQVLLDGADLMGSNLIEREGIVLHDDFHSEVIPQTYADLINYVDCMIDPVKRIYIHNESRKYWPNYNKTIESYIAGQIVSWKPFLSQDDAIVRRDRFRENRKRRQYNDSLRHHWVHTYGLEDRRFRHIYDSLQQSGEQLPLDIISLFSGDRVALDSARLYPKMASCSMDETPVRQLAYIGKLAAAAADWDLFMKAHLNIMNDRFHASIRSSYGEASRQTFVADLEAIGVSLADLFVGTLLQVSDSREGHYQSSPMRMGRAVSELYGPEEVISLLSAAASDPRLDINNRLQMYYTLRAYEDYTKDAQIRRQLVAILESMGNDYVTRLGDW